MAAVYEAVELVVDAALHSDNSLITPGVPVWTLEHVADFHQRFVVQEDLSKDSFNLKLQRQLEGAPTGTIQLAAELLFFHSLGVSNQGLQSKRLMIEPLLDMAGMELPESLHAALADGVANHGAGLAHRDAYVRLLGRFMLAWKQLPTDQAESLLDDPYAFRSFVFDLPPGADAAQRNMLIHLAFPDVFEPIASPYAKEAIVACFAENVSDASSNVDAQLAEVRQALSGRYGEGFQFYEDELQAQWGTVKDKPQPGAEDPVAAIETLVEAMYPDPDLRDLLLNLVADSVEAAHAANPRAWGLGPDAKHSYLGLNVGRLATVVLHPGRVVVALHSPDVTDELARQLTEASVLEGRDYGSLLASHYWILQPDLIAAFVDQLRLPLARHIEHAAAAVSVTPYARFHSAAAGEYLATATSRAIPTPQYPSLPEIPGKTGWDGFVAWAARVFDEERFDEWERNYKLAIATRLQAARDALLDERGDWWDLLKVAFTKDNNLTPWQQHSKFYQWARSEPDAAKQALRKIWNADADLDERIRNFLADLPVEVVGGSGTRLAIASFLLMVDPDLHPIYRPTPFQDAWRLTGWQAPGPGSDEADVYRSALDFMDELRRRLSDAGVETRDRLDAQGLIFAIVHWNEPPQYLTPEERDRLVRFKAGKTDSVPAQPEVEPIPDEPLGYVEPSFDEILERFEEAGFRIDPATLLRFHLSLKTRGFVILSGVSGTGKSWLTRLYAEAVGGVVQLVPVAPNWTTNEDLLGFHNPVSGAYVDTDFSRFLRSAAQAQADADELGVTPKPYFVVLDEMNLARVEYYFAKFLSVMEARDQGSVAIELSADERLPLPANLYAVGTVNVDETTHGFADKVYDRAQVIELPISATDIAAHAGEAPHAGSLLQIWAAVEPVAPFAFRVVDEIAAYASAAGDAGLDWETALDHQVLQKVLPKLARADDRVGKALLAVLEVCGETLPMSAAKAEAMHQNLEEHGFASYF